MLGPILVPDLQHGEDLVGRLGGVSGETGNDQSLLTVLSEVKRGGGYKEITDCLIIYLRGERRWRGEGGKRERERGRGGGGKDEIVLQAYILTKRDKISCLCALRNVYTYVARNAPSSE